MAQTGYSVITLETVHCHGSDRPAHKMRVKDGILYPLCIRHCSAASLCESAPARCIRYSRLGGCRVRKINGSHHAVVGLPLVETPNPFSNPYPLTALSIKGNPYTYYDGRIS